MTAPTPSRATPAERIEARLRRAHAAADAPPPAAPAAPPPPPRLTDAAVDAALARLLDRPADEPAGPALARFLDRAAVSGRFTPGELFDPATPAGVRREVLGRAEAACTVDPTGDRPRWVLRPAERREALARLHAAGTLPGLLAEPLPATDHAGDLLRDLLRRGPAVPLDRPADELVVLKGLVDEVAGAGVPLPDPEEVRRHLNAGAFAREYLPAPADFVGRDAELRRLDAFLAARPVGRRRAGPGWSGLVVTGLGGAGKSALLTRFLHNVHGRQAATLVVLDFDRPGIDPGDRAWLNAEAARQVGLQHPAAEPALRLSRRAARGATSGYRSDDGFESQAVARSTDELLYAVRDALAAAGGKRPLLLVFDTAELLTEPGARGRLREWVDAVAHVLAPVPVKVLVSGRLYDDELEDFRRWSKDEPLVVDELPRPQAARVMVNSGATPRLADAVLGSETLKLPRRPLELRLVGRLAARAGASAESLAKELDGGGNPLTVGLIYNRVLRRLGSGVVEKLAAPGLVLRYITPELIEHVLAPVLNLPGLTGAAARAALDRLAAHSWLVTRDARGRVWHRRDLRRSMLRLLLAGGKTGTREEAEAVSRAAAEFFTSGPAADPAEALYHRLLLVRDPGDGADIPLGDLKAAYPAIRPDADDLSPPAAALLRYATRGARVRPADVELLPAVYFSRACDKAGRQLVQQEEFARAARLLRRERAAGAGPAADWELATLFQVADWETLTARLGAGAEGYGAEAGARAAFHAAVLGRGAAAPDPYALLPRAAADASPDPQAVGCLAPALVLAPPPAHHARWRGQVAALVGRTQEAARAHPSGLLGHRLFLLQLLAGRPARPRYPLAPSVLPLRPAVLDELAALADLAPLGGLLRAAAAGLRDRDRGRRPTTQSALAAADALYRHGPVWQEASVAPRPAADERLVSLLRGPDPEFRHPVRFAALAAFADPDGRRELGAILLRVLDDVRPADLDPEPWAEAVGLDPERALRDPVELVVRAWRTGELLDALCAARPGSDRLAWVREGYRRWDRAVEAVLATRFKNRTEGFPWLRPVSHGSAEGG
jgi:hypothetical protein